MRNSNKKMNQSTLDNTIIEESWHFIGIFTKNEPRKFNSIPLKVWSFGIDRIPEFYEN